MRCCSLRRQSDSGGTVRDYGWRSYDWRCCQFLWRDGRPGEVFDEIIADLQKFDAIAPYRSPYPKQSSRVFDHHVLAFVLQELLLRRGVKLLLHTRFVDVRLSGDGLITECIVCGKSGPEALRAKVFLDCTGEAEVARAAGFAIMKGRPEDGMQLPMSMMYFVRHVDKEHATPQLPEGWLHPVRTKQDLPMTSIWPNGPGSNALKIKVPKFDATNTESMTAAEIQARRRAWRCSTTTSAWPANAGAMMAARLR